MKLLTPFVILFVWFNVGCATVKVPDFYAYVTLPASGDGYGIKTVSKEEKRIDKKEWNETKRKGLIILPADWSILKKTIRRNCITNKCEQAVGALDNLFIVIDSALQKVDLPK